MTRLSGLGILFALALAGCSPEVRLAGFSANVNDVDRLLFSTAFACASGSDAEVVSPEACPIGARIQRALLERSGIGLDVVDLLRRNDATCSALTRAQFSCRLSRQVTGVGPGGTGSTPPRVVDSRFDLTIVTPRRPTRAEEVRVSLQRFDTPQL